MMYCPTCQTEYDDEVIRFCTKDGSPLVDKEQPVFTDNMPSASSEQNDEEDEGAQTIIRRKAPAPTGTEPLTPSALPESEKKEDSQRIVISTEENVGEQKIRPKTVSHRSTPLPPKRSNLAIVILLTIIATVMVLMGAFAVFWFLTTGGNDEGNTNISVNEDINANQDLNVDTNFNIDDLNINTDSNLDGNSNANFDSNFNLSMPTPSKTPTPSPSPSASPSVSPSPTTSPSASPSSTISITTPTPSPRATITIPSATRTPVRTPTPTKPPANTNTNSTVNVGTLNGRATRLPSPVYPSSARNARAAGRVVVNVTIDRRGNVVSAKAVKGHPLLRSSAEAAARRSKFKPFSVNGRSVNARGSINYNFVN